MNQLVAGLIPARLGSTRLKSKPLQDLGGEPLIWRVYQEVVSLQCFSYVAVITDHVSIYEAIIQRGGSALMSPMNCTSGSARVAYGWHRYLAQDERLCGVVNIQGDEPFLSKDSIQQLCNALKKNQVHSTAPYICSLYSGSSEADCRSPNRVKVLLDQDGFATKFIRHGYSSYIHVGVYGFSRSAIPILTLPRTPSSKQEDLEQLTWMDHSVPIQLFPCQHLHLSIDTEEDLYQARKRWNAITQ